MLKESGHEILAGGLAPFAEALGSCAQDLRKVLTGNEQAFMDVGESVVGFFGGATGFSSSATGLADSLSDGLFEQLVDRLEADAASVTETCGEDCMVSCADILGRFDAIIADTYTHAAAFKRIVKQLQMLGISTRIESARLGSASSGFQTLADDVEQLAGRIVEDFDAIKGRTQALSLTVADFREDASVMANLQQQCVTNISGTLGRNVRALRDVYAEARESSAALSQQAANISSNMSEVVTSIQSHDIIRQQVEHVAEVLEETVGELVGAGVENGDGQQRDMLLGWVADIAKLQTAQLGNSRESFHDAMEHVADSLDDISKAVADSVRTIEQSLAADGRGGAEIIGDVRTGTGEVLNSLRRYEQLNATATERINSLADIVDAIFASLENIEEVGAEIELIALNASIKSARVGTEGRALSVLAESIQKLSVEAREHKDRFSENTQDISDASATLKTHAAAMLDRDKLKAFANSQQDILGQLDGIYTRMAKDLGNVRAEGRQLSQAMAAFAAGLDIHHRMCPRFAEGVARLENTAEEAAAQHSGEAVERPERLEQILSRYTMDSERVIHDRLTGADGGSDDVGDPLWDDGDELWGTDDPPVAPDTPASEDDWDNVELF